MELVEGREGPCEARGAGCADAIIYAGGAWGVMYNKALKDISKI
jgi:hypothetical protein